MRVQTQAGLSAAGQLIFNYNAGNESVEVRSVRVIKPDGNAVTTGTGNIQDLSAPVTREAPMYTDAKQKHVTVAGLSVGDAIEYDVVTNSKPLLPSQFWRIESLTTNGPCLDREIELNVPVHRALKLKSPQQIEPTIKTEGDRRIYTWKTSTLHFMSIADVLKNFRPSVTNLLQGPRLPIPERIMFSTFQSWSEVGAWYAGLERDRSIPDTEIQKLADGIVKDKTTDLAKVQALYDWVSRNIRYVSLSFGIGRIQPHAASEVLANRYGDCKDKSTLLEAMLQAEGLHGEPGIIDSVVDVDPDVPSPLQFDHVITHVLVEGKEHWLDSTVGVAPFDYLLPQLRGKSVLLVSRDKPAAIVRTPESLPFPTVYRFTVEGDITDDAKLDAVVTLQTRSDLEVLIRLFFARMSPSQIQSAMDQELKQLHGPSYESQFSDFKVSDTSDLTKPVEAKMHFVGKLQYVDLKPISPREFARGLSAAIAKVDLLHLLLPQLETPTKSNDNDASPIRLGGPKEYSLEFVLTVPTLKANQDDHPNAVHLSSDYAEYDANSSWSGQTIHANWRLNLSAPEVPAKASAAYADFVTNVDSSLTKDVVIATNVPVKGAYSDATSDVPASAAAGLAAGKGPPGFTANANPPLLKDAAAPTPVIPTSPPSAATALLKQGQDEVKRQNWANAIQSFQAALKLDPEYPEAWDQLGRVYMSMRRYKDAEEAFRKHLQFEPDSRLAYIDMAWVLYTERKFEEDAQILEKRVASAPNDGDAHTRLGAAYLALHQPSKAVPELEKGTSLYPRYEYAQITLARAYLAAGLNDKASAAFTKAIELDDSDSTLNTAAYELAQKNCSLDLAEHWATRAVETVELELNGLTADVPQARVSTLVSKLSQYWDTLGWVKFQQNDYASAEKYLRATWQLRHDTTPGMHLGRVYEVEGRNDDAVDMYAEAVAVVPPNGVVSDDEKQAHERMTALLWNQANGSKSQAQQPAKPKSDDSLSIPNPAGKQGIAQFRLTIGPDSKADEIHLLGSDIALADFVNQLRSVTLPQSFPDRTLKKLPRVGTLACVATDQACKLTLMPTAAAARVVEY